MHFTHLQVLRFQAWPTRRTADCWDSYLGLLLQARCIYFSSTRKGFRGPLSKLRSGRSAATVVELGPRTAKLNLHYPPKSYTPTHASCDTKHKSFKLDTQRSTPARRGPVPREVPLELLRRRRLLPRCSGRFLWVLVWVFIAKLQPGSFIDTKPRICC